MNTFTLAPETEIERPSTEEILEAVASQFNTTRKGAIEWLAEVNWDHYLQDETPITHDMDLSIHEPSIRTGESVSGKDQFEPVAALNNLESDNSALQSAIEGMKQVVADAYAKLDAAKGLLQAANCPQCVDKSGAYYGNNGEACQCQWCFEVSMLLPTTEHPTSSGAGTRQDNQEPEEGALDDLSDIPIWLRKPNA